MRLADRAQLARRQRVELRPQRLREAGLITVASRLDLLSRTEAVAANG